MNQSFLIQELTTLKSLFDENAIGIVIGDRLNLDTAAAALSLFLSLNEAGKKVQIISKKEPIVEISNLVGVDKIKKSFTGESNRVVVSLPYNRGEIGKVSYKEEQDKINFYLTAADGRAISPYETKDINLIWEGASPSVIVVFGATNALQVREFANPKDNTRIVNIDTVGEPFGDVALVDPSFSSSSELVAKIIKELRLPINIDIAQNLLAGILYATRNFSKQNTSPLAFEAAGILMQAGAVRSDERNQGRGTFFQPNRPKDKNQPKFRPNENIQNRARNEEAETTPREENKNSNYQNINNGRDNNADKMNAQEEVPNDWLMPKVFKGSQDINDLK